MQPSHVLSDVTPELLGDTHAGLTARYFRHTAAIECSHGALRAWHILAARGLYRLLADLECDGGPAAPMGMPHVLCLSDEEACQLASASALREVTL